MKVDQGEIVIVGAGITGLATSLALHRLGLKSIVLESSNSLRISGYGIMIYANAWRALDALGVGMYLREHHVLLKEVQAFSTVSGVVTSTVPLSTENGDGNKEARCLVRRVLLETLANDLPQGTIKYSSKVVHIEEYGFHKLVHLADGSSIMAKALIGCDGVNSVVAKWLKLSEPFHTQRIAARGIAEFPDGHGIEPKMFRHYGNGILHGFVPCDDKSVYWYWTSMSSEQMDKDIENNPAKVKEFVLENMGNAPKIENTIIQNTHLENINLAPITMRRPWDMLLKNISKDNVCVAGDALHPMTPDIGQGGCSALEDAVILARCLGETLIKKENITTRKEEDEDDEEQYRRINDGLKKFVKERRWRCFKIMTMSYLIGKIQQSSGSLIKFLRDNLISGILIRAQLKIVAFDCGHI